MKTIKLKKHGYHFKIDEKPYDIYNIFNKNEHFIIENPYYYGKIYKIHEFELKKAGRYIFFYYTIINIHDNTDYLSMSPSINNEECTIFERKIKLDKIINRIKVES